MRSNLTASALVGLPVGCFALAIAVVAAAPARADLLVLRDGSRVETSGSWEVKGRLVVFRTADDTLASLRLAEVDLEASERATAEEAARRAEAEEAAKRPPEKRPAVLVLTDADVAPASGAAAEGEGESAAGSAEAPAVDGDPGQDSERTEGAEGAEGAAGGEGGEAAAAQGGLVVDSWEQESDAKGILVSGVVRNGGDQIATGVAVTVRIYDGAGGLLGRASAPLAEAVLPPGASAEFRAFFPEVAAFESVKFEVEGTRFERRGEEDAGGDTAPR